MKLKNQYIKALDCECPYCHAKQGESCRVKNGSNFTNDTEPRDQWGRPLIHESRIKINDDSHLFTKGRPFTIKL